jgi:hypothetical protein
VAAEYRIQILPSALRQLRVADRRDAYDRIVLKRLRRQLRDESL